MIPLFPDCPCDRASPARVKCALGQSGVPELPPVLEEIPPRSHPSLPPGQLTRRPQGAHAGRPVSSS